MQWPYSPLLLSWCIHYDSYILRFQLSSADHFFIHPVRHGRWFQRDGDLMSEEKILWSQFRDADFTIYQKLWTVPSKYWIRKIGGEILRESRNENSEMIHCKGWWPTTNPQLPEDAQIPHSDKGQVERLDGYVKPGWGGVYGELLAAHADMLGLFRTIRDMSRSEPIVRW